MHPNTLLYKQDSHAVISFSLGSNSKKAIPGGTALIIESQHCCFFIRRLSVHVEFAGFPVRRTTFCSDLNFKIIGAWMHISKFMIAVSTTLCPFERILTFLADVLVVQIQFHIGYILLLLRIDSHIHFTAMIEVLIVVRIFKI